MVSISLSVPEPSAYVLHKFIISNRRKKSSKREKDIETACQLGMYLLGHENQRHKMRKMFSQMPEKWQKELMRIVKYSSEKIFVFLRSEKQ
jgi:hypothetical protein